MLSIQCCCRELDSIARNVTQHGIYTHEDTEDILDDLEHYISEFQLDHEHIYLGESYLRRFHNLER